MLFEIKCRPRWTVEELWSAVAVAVAERVDRRRGRKGRGTEEGREDEGIFGKN